MTVTPSQALVLTARPGSRAISDGIVARARRALEPEQVLTERWLAPCEAWECCLSVADAAVTRKRVAAALATAPVDVNVVAADPATRRKRLIVSDMDSTIIEQECIDEMADMLGLKPRIAAITERAMRGELDFEAALKERLALLAGLPEADLERVFVERVTLMPGARTLTATMRASGAFTALVSGGFSFFTQRVAAAAGFEVDHANTLEIADGRLTGRVAGAILGREAKLATLNGYTARLCLVREATLAVGDGANDLAMIQAAGLGVAYRAKPVVAAEAHASIVHGDLTALLYLQGYRRDELVAR
ncbi:MAG: phosphoserine phosphatase SerB [Hyphomicrobiaceae bacterium]|nr:phosphoserine phosphatase SerB [Hyphomicrobiaceae bacterium]